MFREPAFGFATIAAPRRGIDGEFHISMLSAELARTVTLRRSGLVGGQQGDEQSKEAPGPNGHDDRILLFGRPGRLYFLYVVISQGGGPAFICQNEMVAPSFTERVLKRAVIVSLD